MQGEPHQMADDFTLGVIVAILFDIRFVGTSDTFVDGG